MSSSCVNVREGILKYLVAVGLVIVNHIFVKERKTKHERKVFTSTFSLSSSIKVYILIRYVECVTVFILDSNILSDRKIRNKMEEVISWL